MEVFFEAHKITKFTIYNAGVFLSSGGGVDEVLVRL